MSREIKDNKLFTLVPPKTLDTAEKKALWLLLEGLEEARNFSPLPQDCGASFMMLGGQRLAFVLGLDDVHDAIRDLGVEFASADGVNWIYERALDLGVVLEGHVQFPDEGEAIH
jgi:hypothetical protein